MLCAGATCMNSACAVNLCVKGIPGTGLFKLHRYRNSMFLRSDLTIASITRSEKVFSRANQGQDLAGHGRMFQLAHAFSSFRSRTTCSPAEKSFARRVATIFVPVLFDSTTNSPPK